MEWYYAEDGERIGPNSTDAMRHHINNGRINAETLIWSASLGGWQPLRSVNEFSSLVRLTSTDIPPPPPIQSQSAVPPELPSTDQDQRAPEASTSSPKEQAEIAAAPATSSATTFTAPPFNQASETRFSVAPPTERDGMSLAGPWSRYFARQIDITIWSFALIAALAVALALLSPPTFYQFLTIPDAALTVISVFIAVITIAIVTALFGNTLGKAIFGIKVYEIGSDDKLPLTSALKRELSVWVFGLALAIPPFTLFTMIWQFIRVNKLKPASYDAGKYLVRQKNVGAGRITSGIIFAFALIVGAIGLAAWGNAPTNASPTAWINPDSGQRTMLPAGWEPERMAEQGIQYSLLFNGSIGQQVVVGAEELAVNTLDQYASALGQALSSEMTLNAWQPGSQGLMMMTTARSDQGYPVDIYVYKVGNRYWRVIGFDMTATRSGHFLNPQLLNAVVQSMN